MSNTRGNIFGLLKTAGSGKGVGDNSKLDKKQTENESKFVEDMYDSNDVEVRKSNAQKFVEKFYNLVTDFYETGWGQSFHFAPRGKQETFRESIIRHEHYLALKLNIKDTDLVLDAGCGIGGPMRNIQQFTNAQIIGVTINDYQVNRGNTINSENGFNPEQCKIIQGDYCKLSQFKDNTFDKIFAIESTCHSPDRCDVYKELYRVLKPGGLFGTYEWVLKSDKYNPNNSKHKHIKYQIEKGNALPDLINDKICMEKLTKVGFKLVLAEDLDSKSRSLGQHAWHQTLAANYSLENFHHTYPATLFTHYFCWVMETIGLAPKGTFRTHQILKTARDGLVKGGNLEIFTPMLFLIGQKPYNNCDQIDTEI